MSEMHERLRQARKLAGYDTARAATDALGLHYPTYLNHEGGHRDFRKWLPKYASLFRVNLGWLATGRGTPKGKVETHPVVELFEAIPPEKQPQAIEYLEFLKGR